MGNPPWACLRKKDLGWDRGVESKKVVQHVYLVGAKSIYRVAEKDKEYLRDEEEKNQNTASTHHPTPHHPHPEERIWAGRQPWVPDAPKIKHDKMKQFYMIDMERKM